MALYLSGPEPGQPIVDTRNPFPDLYNGENTYTNNFVKGNFLATYKVTDHLNWTAQYSGQYNNNTRDRYNELNFCYTDLNFSNKTKPLDYPSTLNIYRGVTDNYYFKLFLQI